MFNHVILAGATSWFFERYFPVHPQGMLQKHYMHRIARDDESLGCLAQWCFTCFTCQWLHGLFEWYMDVLYCTMMYCCWEYVFFFQTKVLVSISPGDGSRSMQTCAQNRRAEWPESEQRPIRWCPARWAPSNQLACFRQRTPLTRIRQDTCHIHIIHPKSGAFAAISF